MSDQRRCGCDGWPEARPGLVFGQRRWKGLLVRLGHGLRQTVLSSCPIVSGDGWTRKHGDQTLKHGSVPCFIATAAIPYRTNIVITCTLLFSSYGSLLVVEGAV